MFLKAFGASLLFCIVYGLAIVLQSVYVKNSISPLQLLFLTNTVCFFILSAVFSLSHRSVFRLHQPRSILYLFLIAALTWIAADISSIFGLKLSVSINFSIISRLNLFLTFIGAVLFLGEKKSPRKMIALLLAFFGTIITVYSGGEVSMNAGDLLFLVFAVLISVSGLLRQKISPAMGVRQMTFWMFGLSALVNGALVAFLDPLSGIPVPGFILVNSVLGLAGFTLVNYAISRGGAPLFSLVSSLLPVSAAFFSFTITGQTPVFHQIAGAVIIMGAIVLFVKPVPIEK